MVILGLIVLLVGYLAGIGLLVTIGWVLFLLGAILLAVSFIPSGPIAGRRFY